MRSALTVVRVDAHAGIGSNGRSITAPSASVATSTLTQLLYGTRSSVPRSWPIGKSARVSSPQRPAPSGAENSSIGESTDPSDPKIWWSGSRARSNGAYARAPLRTVNVRQSGPSGIERVTISSSTVSVSLAAALSHAERIASRAYAPTVSLRANW